MIIICYEFIGDVGVFQGWSFNVLNDQYFFFVFWVLFKDFDGVVRGYDIFCFGVDILRVELICCRILVFGFGDGMRSFLLIFVGKFDYDSVCSCCCCSYGQE